MAAFSNPFQVTNPVDPVEVIDRNDETERLMDLAEEGNNARLVAPRRYGKTSLARRVQARLATNGEWEVVYVDLLGILTLDDFAERIERAYTKVLTGRLAKWFTGIRRSLRPTITLGGGPLPAAGSIDLGAQTRGALLDRLSLPVKVHEKAGLRVHVIFDEFQELDHVDGQADAVVRSEIQHHGRAASYLFSGSHLSMMEMIFADARRAFYGQTQPVYLQPLNPTDLAEYIADRFETTGKHVEADALDGLLELSGGHPQRSMAAAHALWDATEAAAGLEEWESARACLIRDLADELRTAWSNLDVRERQALVAVASGEAPFSRGSGRPRGGGLADALQRLEGRGVIARHAKTWDVVDPLLARWAREGRD